MRSARYLQFVPGWRRPILLMGVPALIGFASVAFASVDLSISDISLDTGTLAPGEPIRLQLVVHHTGSCPDCGPLQISSWDDSTDGNVNCQDGDDLSVEADLTTDGDITVPLTLNGYPRPGRYRAWFWVDCQQTVSDPDQSNNKQAFDIVLVGEDSGQGVPIDTGQPSDAVVDPPADPNNSGSPGFCGLFGGQTALSAAVIPTLFIAGFLGLKARRSW